MTLTPLFLLVLFCLGAAVGSFISVLLYRLHSKQKGILTGRSKCRDCEKPLSPLDLIPIASYLMLRGKCRYCNKEISYMYPVLEMVTGGLFALLFLKFPFLNNALQFSGQELGLYLLYGFYAFVLIFTFFYDLHYLEISDEILLPAILVALIATLGFPVTPHITDALIGGLIGTAFFGFQYLISKGTWVGLGDLRMGAFMGVILGWKLVLVALFVSYMLGSVVAIFVAAKKKKFKGVKIPFAPILATGTFVTIFFGESLMSWYLRGLGF